MTDATVQILGLGSSPVPLEYNVPGGPALDLMAVNADFDGISALVDFVPVVEIVSSAGEVMARGVGSSIAAGGSASVTFAPFLRRPTTPTPGGVTLDDVIIAAGPDFFYKLDELTGSTAHDSSGNGHDATVPVGQVAPAWAQTFAPTGVRAPLFTKTGTPSGFTLTYPAMTGDFTLLGWFRRPDTNEQEFAGQGTAIVNTHPGWALGIEAANEGLGNRALVVIGSAGGLGTIEGDNPLLADEWHFQGVRHSGSTWSQFVDGAVQSSTSTHAYTATANFWLGWNGNAQGFTGNASYVQFYLRSLSDAAVGAIFSAAPQAT